MSWRGLLMWSCAAALLIHARPSATFIEPTQDQLALDQMAEVHLEQAVNSAEQGGGTTEPIDPYVGEQRRHPTEQEWREVVSALAEVSPRRFEAMQRLADNPRRQRLRAMIYSRYQTLKRVRDTFPRLYEVQIERIKIEDNVFDVYRRLTAASNPAQHSKLREELRDQIQMLFENSKRDRQVRISRFKDWAAELEAKQAEDDRQRDVLVDQQLQQVIARGPTALDHINRKERMAPQTVPAVPSESGTAPEEPTTTQPSGGLVPVNSGSK